MAHAMGRTAECAAATALVVLTALDVGPARGQIVRVGRGSYATTFPKGKGVPSAGRGRAAEPFFVDRALRPVPTTDWWTSLVWKRRPDRPFSENLYAHPLAFRAKSDGLGVSYPTHVAIDPKGRSYHHNYGEDLVIGLDGLAAKEVRVAGFGDWTVTARWAADGRRLDATIGHGLPYVYCQAQGGDAVVTFRGKPKVLGERGSAAAVSVRGHAYGLFAPAGSRWRLGDDARSTRNGRGYFSVALLPDEKPATLDLFARHAFAFVTDTRVTWRYDQPKARLTARYEWTTKPREGTEARPLAALYRHQWLNTSAKPAGPSYASPRGEMKLLAASSFETAMPFGGVLPGLPGIGTGDRDRLRGYVEAAAAADKPLGTRDTYWTGKALGRLASLVHVADQADLPAARDVFLRRIKAELEAWFTAGDARAPRQFHYEPTWGTLIGYPASYGSDTQLNDHHFHYGYFIMAAAAVARFDRRWAAPDQWGGMVELLIRDAANWDRKDRRFCFLRCFDPYAGHGWASGHAAFAAGNNQESSSESLNFAAAVVLWGAATGDRAIRDLGIYLYANETRAVQQYWFDVDRAVFPKGFRHTTVGMVWGNGGAYATWWTANPEEIHGINFLPITGGSLYLGRRPDYVRRNLADLVATNGGPEREWRDIIWSFEALADAPGVAAKLAAAGGLKPTSGMSRAHTYQWIHAMSALGRADTSVTADVPTYAVFRRDDGWSCAAWNPAAAPADVTFSNGAKLRLAPGTMGWMTISTPARH